MYDLFIYIATISSTLLSISIAFFAFYSYREGNYFHIKNFIKFRFKNAALLLIAAPVFLHLLFNGVIPSLWDPDPGAVSCWYILLGLVVFILFIVIIVRIVNEAYYALLEAEPYDGFDLLAVESADGGYRSFPLRRYAIMGRARKLYPHLVTSKGGWNIKDIDPELFEIIRANIVDVYSHDGCFLKSEDHKGDMAKRLNDLIGRYPRRGIFIPRIQSPTDICKICSTYLLDMGIMDEGVSRTMKESCMRNCIALLYSAMLYANRHQDPSGENKAVGRYNYISPRDSVLLSMLSACFGWLYCGGGNMSLGNNLVLKGILHSANMCDPDNRFAKENRLFLENNIPPVRRMYLG